MSKIITDLLKQLPLEPAPIRAIYIGLYWTIICSTHCGVASTLVTSSGTTHHQICEAGKLHLKTAQELAQWALSEDILEASIGIAAINSLLSVDENNVRFCNGTDVLLEKGRNKNVAVVGHFPFVTELQSSFKNLWVLEKCPQPGDYPAEAADDLIPQADVVAITGTALINHTMDHLLTLPKAGTTVIVLGPSSPLSSVLYQYGVNYISGLKVINENYVIQAITQGGTFRQLGGIELITLCPGDYPINNIKT
jgi:uncharacterized protein (DUF4213/DUF364 family)